MKPIMIIGGKSYQDSPNPRVGGTTVLLDNLLEYCAENGIPYIYVSTNKYYKSRFSPILNYVLMLWNVLFKARQCSSLMVNISSKYGTLIMLPYIVIIAKLFGLPSVCRQFAGSLHYYLEAKTYRKKIVFWCLKHTKVSFFETRELIKYFESNDYNAEWFPNVRKPVNNLVYEKEYRKRYVFISRVTETKGIKYLIEAFKKLGPDYNVDIFGPVDNDIPINELSGENYRYKGLLKSKDVIDTLCLYDALVLPTHWSAEGYPGIVLESYAAGVPVIVSKIGGIKEIVEDGKTGFLTEPKNSSSVVEAIHKLEKTDCMFVSACCREYFNKNFNSDIVNGRIINLINR